MKKEQLTAVGDGLIARHITNTRPGAERDTNAATAC